jgi:prepilin-type N-terminal cleavage/methylation domain-containing protein/prepilin-type processing-associated H-X9-DG protein
MKHLNRRRDRGRKGLTLLEILAVIFIIAVVTAILLPSMNRAHRGDWRTKCSSNMRQIGQAILLYANENKGNYPRTFYNPGAPLSFSSDASDGGKERDPFGNKGVAGKVGDNEVIAGIFLLIRTQDITPEVFVCPSSDAEKDPYGSAPGASAQNKTSFTDWRKNLSYSFTNMYPDDAAVKEGYKVNTTVGAEFAIAADMNPGVGDRYDVTAMTESASQKEMMKANSRNHQGQGENVLYGDGHAEFQQNPFCGNKRDNIYTVSGSTDGSVTTSKTVVGSPKWTGDSVLLPAWK